MWLKRIVPFEFKYFIITRLEMYVNVKRYDMLVPRGLVGGLKPADFSYSGKMFLTYFFVLSLYMVHVHSRFVITHISCEPVTVVYIPPLSSCDFSFLFLFSSFFLLYLHRRIVGFRLISTYLQSRYSQAYHK